MSPRRDGVAEGSSRARSAAARGHRVSESCCPHGGQTLLLEADLVGVIP